MPRLTETAVPAYRRHKSTGQAIVTLDGRDFYLGKHGTASIRGEYNRRIAKWLAAGRKLPIDSHLVTVGEIVVAYKKYAERYYRKPGGTPTGEAV